jgi:hypothetical protein
MKYKSEFYSKKLGAWISDCVEHFVKNDTEC